MKDNVPNVFLSWSGDKSREVAERFKELFTDVFDPTIKCFISTRDIVGGRRGTAALAEELEKCNYGIFFVDSKNVRAPWLQFEAGAISKMVSDSRVMVLLLDNAVGCLNDTPLSDFQYKLFNKEHVKSIFEEIIDYFEQKESKDSYLKRFEREWDTFYEKAEKILSAEQKDNDVKNDENDELKTIQKMLIDVQNFLKSEYSQTLKEGAGIVSELKKMLINMDSDDLKDMKMRFKVQRYELIFQKIVQEIEAVLDSIENNKDCNVQELKEKLNNIIVKTMPLLDD